MHIPEEERVAGAALNHVTTGRGSRPRALKLSKATVLWDFKPQVSGVICSSTFRVGAVLQLPETFCPWAQPDKWCCSFTGDTRPSLVGRRQLYGFLGEVPLNFFIRLCLTGSCEKSTLWILVHRCGACWTAGTVTKGFVLEASAGRQPCLPLACRSLHPLGDQAPGQGSGYTGLEWGQFPPEGPQAVPGAAGQGRVQRWGGGNMSQ